VQVTKTFKRAINPLNAELNPICHLLALLGAHHILHISRIRVNFSTKITLKLVHNKCTQLPQHDTIQIKASDDEFIVKRGDCGQGYVTGRIF
jgi:hypothetical protein